MIVGLWELLCYELVGLEWFDIDYDNQTIGQLVNACRK